MTNDILNRMLFRQPRVRRRASTNTTTDTNQRQEEFIEPRNDNDVDAIPSSSTSTKPYTQLNIPTTVHTTIRHPEYTTVESFADEVSGANVNRSNIPPNIDWPGNYDFDITFQSQEKLAKSTTWTYSEVMNKLFVNMAIACPVNVHVKTPPPPGSVIRAIAIFSGSEHITDVAKRCLNHSSSKDPMNEGHPALDHLIRCDNSSSKYVEDYSSGRQSVVTDYEHPQVGMEYTTYLYKFMCLGSCAGGLNRRPLQLIFTLEKDGECLGRKVIGLRICACPGRDKRAEEKQREKASGSKRIFNHPKNLDESGPPMKRQKSSSGDEDSSYTITVYRRSHYEMLKKMADALELAELASLLTPEESSALHQRYIRHKRKKTQLSKESQQSSGESSA